jgi:hypothetical protein
MVGVPVITPVDLFTISPGARLIASKITGEFVAVILYINSEPTVDVAVPGLVISGLLGEEGPPGGGLDAPPPPAGGGAEDPGGVVTELLTTTLNVLCVEDVPSLTVTMMAAVPDNPGEGVTVMVRSAPEPPRTT